jgi:hypothetical protein
VADLGSGLDDGGGDTGPERWVVLVDYGGGEQVAAAGAGRGDGMRIPSQVASLQDRVASQAPLWRTG